MDYEYRNSARYKELAAKVDNSLVGAKISDIDKEIIYDSAYTFEREVSIPYGISMDRVFNNLEKLSAIEHTTNRDMKLLGVYYSNVNENEKSLDVTGRPSIIIINDRLLTDEEDKRETTIHELVHLYSMDYTAKKMHYNDIRGVDEIVTDDLARRMSEYSQSKTINEKETIPTPGGAYCGDMEVKKNGLGYSRSMPYINTLYSAFIESEVIKQKFEGGPLVTDDNFKFVGYKLSNEWETPSLKNYGELSEAIAGAIFSKYQKTNDFQEYMKDAKMLREASPELAVNGEKYNLGDMALAKWEAVCIYPKVKQGAAAVNANAFSRTDMCSDFLKGLSIAKQLDVDITMDDLKSMKTVRGKLENGEPGLEVTLKDKTYITSVSNSTGNVVPEVLAFEEGILAKKTTFKNFLNNHILSSDSSATINMQLVSELNGLGNGLVSRVSRPTNNTELVIDAACGVPDVKHNAVAQALKKVDIEKISDNDGHNLMHIAAVNHSAAQFVSDLLKHDSLAVSRMLQQEDNNGIKPLEYMARHHNVYALGFLADQKLLPLGDMSIFSEKQGQIGGKEYTIFENIASNNPGIAAKLISRGIDTEMECGNGTLLHCAAKLQCKGLMDAVGYKHVNDLNDENERPLDIAIKIKNAEIRRDVVLALLDNGSDPNLLYHRETPLCGAIIAYMRSNNDMDLKNSMIIVKELLLHGADPNGESISKLNGKEVALNHLQLVAEIDSRLRKNAENKTTDVSQESEVSENTGDIKLSKTVSLLKVLVDNGADIDKDTENRESLRVFLESEAGAGLLKEIKDCGLQSDFDKEIEIAEKEIVEETEKSEELATAVENEL